MTKLLAYVLGTASLAIAAVPATSAVVTTTAQTISFGTHLTEFDTTATNPVQSYATQNFALFNSNLGTLQSVSVRATYQEDSTITLKNTGSTTAKGSVSSKSDLFLDASDSGQDAVISNLLNPNGNPLTATGATSNYNGTNGITAGSSRNFTSNSGVADTSYQTTSLASDIAAFSVAGGGNGSVLANTQTFTNTSYSGGNLQSSQTTTASPTFYIYYTYDDSTATAAVPEPATWAMMIAGFGLVGVGLRRRGTALSLS